MNGSADSSNIHDLSEESNEHSMIEAFNFTENAAEFDATVGHIQDILLGQDFQNLLKGFFERYCQEFDYSEENKLHYTIIFQEYVAQIESYLEGRLKIIIPDFDMTAFQTQILEHRDELDGEVFDVISSFGDFLIFKDLMLNYKAVQEGLVDDLSIKCTPAQHY